MELWQLARPAMRAPAPGSAALLSRLTVGRQAILQRQLSTSHRLLAPPPRSTPSIPRSGAAPGSQPASSQPAAAWPPNRTPSPSQAQSPSDADPLKDLYSSDNPSQWALWSSDDFFKRNTAKREPPRVELRPSTGRTVHVSGNVDQARAFQLLSVMCRRNNVQRDFQKQRFHERPGLKRKRLKSQRWRTRFKAAFQATVHRVHQLAKQGW